jgi:predicted nuclease with TOPRIM domain
LTITGHPINCWIREYLMREILQYLSPLITRKEIKMTKKKLVELTYDVSDLSTDLTDRLDSFYSQLNLLYDDLEAIQIALAELNNKASTLLDIVSNENNKK